MSRENLPDQPGLQVLRSDGLLDSSQSDCPGMIEQGYQQFLEDLEGLLRDRRNHRKLAAYHGRRRVCIEKTMEAVWKTCARESIPDDELMIESIAPQPDALHHRLDTGPEAGQPALEAVMSPETVGSGPTVRA